MKIGNKTIGDGAYIIAEFGVNHNGSLERAKEGIKKAAEAGADAIKFQTYTADELVCRGTPKFWNFEDDVDKDQHEAYEGLGGEPMEWYPELMAYCEECGIEFLTTCFSTKTADYFNELGMKAFKVASSDLSTIPYLKHIARYNKPILLSTGAATIDEIDEAVAAIEGEGNSQIVIMQCTLCYPTMYPDKEVHYEDANLNVLHMMNSYFGEYDIGISDHTQTPFSSVIAYTMGADVIEKHYTVDKTLGKSADHWFSVDPAELKELVDGCKNVDILSGSYEKEVLDCEEETRTNDKRSICSVGDIKKGTVITEDMIAYKRPGTGIWPAHWEEVIGSVAAEDINDDNPIQWEQLTKKTS